MKTARVVVLAIAVSAMAAAAHAQSRDETFFRELDTNGDGVVDETEFTLQKGVLFYLIDKNHDLKIEQSETKLTREAFQQYAGPDGVVDGLDLFDVPGAQFQAFDRNGDQKITRAEFQRQLAEIRSGPQTAEKR
ncbi:MAG: hypothetical protein NVV74_23880 [Magnetospirillum sp.]|nr:hypothetical protein [Magnetospirillum sp.]